MNDLLKRSVKLTVIFVIAIAVVSAIMHQPRFAAGIFIGSIWSVLNFVFTFNLFDIALLKQSKARVWLLLVVKFPLLYVIGFLILVSRFYPVASLCAGLALMPASIAISKIFVKSKELPPPPLFAVKRGSSGKDRREC